MTPQAATAAAGTLAQLEGLGDTVRHLEAELAAALSERNRLIVTAVENEWNTATKVSRVAGISKSQVLRVIERWHAQGKL
jgi:DNA-directed RNA polymerase specialized sigma subunit